MKKIALKFIMLKHRIKEQLPTDVILFQCCHCKSELLLNINGVIKVYEALDQELSKIIDEMCKTLIKDHHLQSKKCVSSEMNIHSLLGTPQNIILSFPESDIIHLKDFIIEGDNYKVDVAITPMTSDTKAIFVLYHKVKDAERKYSNFIKCYFNTFLKVEGDKHAHQLEVWQLPIVNSVTDIMISHQEEETLLVSNKKDMEKFIMESIIDE